MSKVRFDGSTAWHKPLFGTVVAVVDILGFAYSKDEGMTFTQVELPGAEGRRLNAVRRIGDEVFVAGSGGYIAKTSDLESFAEWTNLTYDEGLDYIDICVGADTFVALANGDMSGTRCSVGSLRNPGQFETRSLPGELLGRMAFGNGVFVSPSGVHGGDGAYSADGGASWSAVKVSASRSYASGVLYADSCRNVCYGNGVFFAASGVYDLFESPREYSYSRDGISWNVVQTEATPEIPEALGPCSASFFLDGRFYAIAGNAAFALDSSNVAAGPVAWEHIGNVCGVVDSAFVSGNSVFLAGRMSSITQDPVVAAFRGSVKRYDEHFARTIREFPFSTFRDVIAL